MRGTEKQIKWVEDIKAGAFRQLDLFDETFERDAANGIKSPYTHESIDAVRQQITEVFAKIDDAAKIIDRREMFSFRRLLNAVEAQAKRMG